MYIFSFICLKNYTRFMIKVNVCCSSYTWICIVYSECWKVDISWDLRYHFLSTRLIEQSLLIQSIPYWLHPSTVNPTHSLSRIFTAHIHYDKFWPTTNIVYWFLPPFSPFMSMLTTLFNDWAALYENKPWSIFDQCRARSDSRLRWLIWLCNVRQVVIERFMKLL